VLLEEEDAKGVKSNAMRTVRTEPSQSVWCWPVRVIQTYSIEARITVYSQIHINEFKHNHIK
jgi:hypothetical protein